MKDKCDICNAQDEDSGGYRNHWLCAECFREYLAILQGWVSSVEEDKELDCYIEKKK